MPLAAQLGTPTHRCVLPSPQRHPRKLLRLPLSCVDFPVPLLSVTSVRGGAGEAPLLPGELSGGTAAMPTLRPDLAQGLRGLQR